MASIGVGATRLAGHGARGQSSAMHTLMLLRHAKSSWDDNSLSDHARPLNRRGRLAAEAMREVMRGLGLTPDLVLVSSSRRTLQTMEALEPWTPAPRVEPLDTLYLASADAIVDVLSDVAESVGCALLIGHNPGLHETAVHLSGSSAPLDTDLSKLQAGFPTGALAVLSCESWAGLARGPAQLDRFILPRDLPDPT